MESKALLQTAAGLERLMVGNKNSGIMKDSNVAQISAYLYYEAQVIAKLETNRAFTSRFQSMLFDSINKDFGAFVDSQARIKPKSLHHVYEWGKAGVPTARLFMLRPIGSNSLSFKIDSEFLMSRSYVPTKRSKKSYKFENKASVMEAGMPVTISPRSSKRLVFEIEGSVVFMPEGASVTVRSPGGKASSHQYRLIHTRFFTGQLVKESIRKSEFTKLFSGAMAKALRVPTSIKKIQYSFSPNTIQLQADTALSTAFGGAL